MFIKKIEIENFRSIKNLTLEAAHLCAIIGPNGSGKSNILKALDMVLGERWTSKARVIREDFYNPLKKIKIRVFFETSIYYDCHFATGSKKVAVDDITLSMSLNPLDVETTINGNFRFYFQDEFKKVCHFIHIPSERQLWSELKVSQWTMLGKLMRIIYENYIKSKGNEDKLKEEFKQKIADAKEFLEDDFDQNEVTFKKFAKCFKKHCQENSAGLASGFDPILNIYNLNWFYKTLQINVNETNPAKCFDSEEVGAGMQNLLLISIFQTYAELIGGNVIFGLEEPEIYLYPHAQRALFQNLIKLSTNTQIFYTTHNPNFLDATRPEDIQILRKDNSKGTYVLVKQPFFSKANADKSKFKIYTHFNPERNELFFANKVLLVEGNSDKICFVTLCKEKFGIDLDQKGYSVIECGGKSGVNYFVGICKLIGQDNFLAVWDQDDPNYQPAHKDCLAEIKTTDQGLEIAENLEKFLGLPTANDENKIENAYTWAHNVKINDIAQDLLKIKDFFEGKLQTKTEVEKAANVEDNDQQLSDFPF